MIIYDDIIRMAGHRDVPPWVLKLVQDCIKAERRLVVQECIDWINENVGLVDEAARADLLKHFGVEE